MHWNLALAAGAVLLVSGCGTPGQHSVLDGAPPYVAPADGPAATLLVRVTQPGGRYLVSAFEQPVSCSHRRQLAAGTDLAPERVSTRLAAGRMQTLSFSYLHERREACEVTLTFESAAGRTYLMRSRFEKQTCIVQLLDVSSPDHPQKVPVVQRETLGLARDDNACRPLTGRVPAAPPPGVDAAESRPTIEDFRQLLPRP